MQDDTVRFVIHHLYVTCSVHFSGRAAASLKITEWKRLQMTQNFKQIRKQEASEVDDTVGCCGSERLLGKVDIVHS